LFVWNQAFYDPYSVSGYIHIAHAVATLHGDGIVAGFTTINIEDPDGSGLYEAVRVQLWDSTPTELIDSTATLTVWTGSL
jgi:hypothetical protein